MCTLEGIKRSREFHKKEGWEDGPKDWAIDYLIKLNTDLLEVCEALVKTPMVSKETIEKAKAVIDKAKEEK